MNWNIPKKPDTDWIGEKILAQEDQLMEQLTAQRFGDTDATPPAADTPPDHVPVDPAVERKEFENLLAQFGNRDEGDADTLVVGLVLDDFDQSTFTPTERDNPDQEEK
jgi:hypothetical protein